MAVELEWRFGDEAPGQGPSQEHRPPRRARRVRLGFGVAAALLLAGVVLYACWRVRSETLVSVEGEVHAVAQLELRALADGDTDLYLSLQDDADPAWREAQETRAWLNALVPPPLPGLAAMTAISVENARVVGDAARVELAGQAGPPGGEMAPFRAVRFYRRSDDGRWLHTRADPDYAGHTIVFTGGWVTVTAFAADAGLARRAAQDLEELAVRTCGAGSCPAGGPVTLVFTGTLDAVLEPEGVLPAPFLVGVPDDEAAEAMWQARLRQLLLDRLATGEKSTGWPQEGSQVSSFRFQVSRITHHVSRNTKYASRIPPHVSRITHHVSLPQHPPQLRQRRDARDPGHKRV